MAKKKRKVTFSVFDVKEGKDVFKSKRLGDAKAFLRGYQRSVPLSHINRK